MVSLISLAALLEPQVLDPFVTTPRIISAEDLPELADVYRYAYADGTSGPDPETATTGITAIFDGARGEPIPQASLLTRDAEGRITAAIIITERTFRSDRPKTAFIARAQGGALANTGADTFLIPAALLLLMAGLLLLLGKRRRLA